MTAAAREVLILSLKSMVIGQAKARMQGLPKRVLLDDLISAGWLGAISAVDHYDPNWQLLYRLPERQQLRGYAKFRIRGAINDYLREIDPLSRDHRRELKRAEAEAPVTISIDRNLNLESIRNNDNPALHELIADKRCTEEQRALEARLTLDVIWRRALASGMKPRNGSVIKRYMAGELMAAIGRSIGVNESRASQLVKDALLKLRAAA